MTSVATGLKCTLFSREDKFGVDLLITNAGTSELLVVLLIHILVWNYSIHLAVNCLAVL